tara:strand:+ start:217 stop:408 length:192 start_codon:yes stop_codon:yes gene_type:complete
MKKTTKRKVVNFKKADKSKKVVLLLKVAQNIIKQQEEIYRHQLQEKLSLEVKQLIEENRFVVV